MKEITKSTVEKWAESYENERNNLIVKHALDKNAISSIVIERNYEKELLPHFSIDLKTLPACNQKASGRCWIFAGCNIIREKIAKKYYLDNFELSQSFIAFYDKLERANFIMEKLMSLIPIDKENREYYHLLTIGVEDGGQWDMFVQIVKKYGLVPKEVMPETYQSSNTTEINRLINLKIRQFAAYVLEGKPNIEALQEETLKDIYYLLVDTYGMPPQVFDFEYTDKEKNYYRFDNLTPLKFYQEYSGIDLDDYISIIQAPTKDKPYLRTFTVKNLGNVIEEPGVFYLNLELSAFKNAILNQLKEREPVWFGSDCNKEFERETGLWDDRLLDYETTFGTSFAMTKEEQLETFESAMNHAMVLTGVNLEEGIPTKWKIENSWGRDKANYGYYVAGDNWFDQYVYQAVVHKYCLSKEALKALEQEPILLMPWDPMGTLA